MTTPRESVRTFGGFRLDPDTESVWRGGDEIRLRPKTFAVLRYLADHPRRLVTKDELLEAVWSDVSVGEAALAVCVAEIRRTLGDDARTPRFIETVHRRGYRFLEPPPLAPAAGGVVATPLVGRAHERERLSRYLTHASRGERRVVFVTGEPGIGKTTLVDAFFDGLSVEDVWLARGQCLDHYGAAEAYLPILDAISRLARASGGERIVGVLRQHAPTWLVQMPSVIGGEEAEALQPRVLGATAGRMLREMADALEALAAERPLVLLLEDLHWSDPSTLDLIAAVAQRRESARLLLVGTYRPADVIVRGHPLRAVAQQLAVRGASEEVPLEPLTELDVARYLTTRFGDVVASRLAATIHRRTDGLPLFMVNVVDALIRQDLLIETADGWVLEAADADVATAVPDTLRQMIEQQLAGLGPEDQRLLEAASAAGMAFSAASVAASLDGDVVTVEDRCEALARREQFLTASGVETWPDGTAAAGYRFLHVLYQQVLYERLPEARRASLHRRIGEREAAGYAGSPGERAAVLAVHFEHGRDAVRAIGYRHHAAEHALRRCAYREAIEHVTRGRAVLEAVPDATERSRLELGLQLTCGTALIALRGSGARDVEAVYLRARELGEALDDLPRLYPALWGLCFVNYSRGQYAEACRISEQLLALAERSGDTDQLLEAHHTRWGTLVATGDAAAAIPHIERGLSLYDEERHRSQAYLFGHHDAGTCARYHLASAQWLLGYPDVALGAVRDARALADRLDHPMTTMICLCSAMWVLCHRGDLGAAEQYANDVVALGTTHGFSGWVDDGVVVRACLSTTGDPRAAIGDTYERLRTGSPGRAAWRDVLCLCMLARAAAERGLMELAAEFLDAIPAAHHPFFFAAEIERMHGELHLRRGKKDAAERSFRRAIAIARGRNERSLELRATTSLVRLLARGERHDETRRMLAVSYGWFTEGLDTRDLREARSVLNATAEGKRGA